MSDLLEHGAQFLDDKRHEHMTRMVVYQRGGTWVEVSATIGQTTFEQEDLSGGGIIQKTESRDFLIRTSDLVLDGRVAVPKVGDRIRERAGGQVFVYEVMAPGTEPPFRYSDPYRKALRIHTKHVATEEGMTTNGDRHPRFNGTARLLGVVVPVAFALLAVTVQWGVVTTKLDHVEQRLDELLVEARSLRMEYQSIERRVSFLEGRFNGRDEP